MRRKKLFFPLLLAFFTTSIVFSKNTLIETPPYSYGEITVKNAIDHTDCFEWFEDTITFSAGIKITFVNIDQFVTRDDIFLGGIIFIDPISQVTYKFNDSLHKTYNWNPPDFYPGEHTFTTNNPDTNWDEAESFPSSLATCDTFVYFGPGKVSEISFFQAKLLFGRYDHTIHPIPYTNTETQENYNAIMYVKTKNNTHFKLQISNIKIKKIHITGGIFSTVLQHIKLYWAVDSLGNGLFKTDTSGINQKTTKHNSQNRIAYISTSYSIPYLYFSNVLQNDNGLQVDIYNLKGKKILEKHINNLIPINLMQFHSGTYLVHITVGREKYIRNFILAR